MRGIRLKLQEGGIGPGGVLIAYKGPLEQGDTPRNMRFDIKLKGEPYGIASAEIQREGLMHVRIYPKSVGLRSVQFDLTY